MPQIVSFQNPGTLDIRAAATFGVSVKREGAIGYFGTGLKYAIGVLLRTGHEVEIFSGLDRFTFASTPTTIQGETFNVITMNGESLEMTTDIGKNWELWMALREIESNCRDEEGSSQLGQLPPIKDHTTVIIRGNDFARVYREELKKIFLDAVPSAITNDIEIINKPSQDLYYRGIIVHQLRNPAVLTYNIKKQSKLTEDRTLAYPYSDGEYEIAKALGACDDEELLLTALCAPNDTYERCFIFSLIDAPSQAFMHVVERQKNNPKLNQSALSLWQSKANKKLNTAVPPLPYEESLIANAISHCNRLGFDITKYPISVAESLRGDTLGMADMRNGEIWLSRSCLVQGQVRTTGTLLEEYLHLEKRFADCSRPMQNFLLDLLITLSTETD